MFELHIIISMFLFTLLSALDFIVFNEEILLTLCFLSFLFYCFNTLSESVSSSFEARAIKFEQDLLLSFGVTKVTLTNEFNAHIKLIAFVTQFTILLSSLLNFLSKCSVYLQYKPSFIYFQLCLSKFNELVLSNKKFIVSVQKACIVQLLYSLILKKSTNDLTFLTYKQASDKKLCELKFLSI
jgi:hypothetical protein